MADDERSELAPGVSAAHSSVLPSDDLVTLPNAVSEWLAARVAVAKGQVMVSVAVVRGRWLFRVDWGSTGSMIDQPASSERASMEIVSAVRRWARDAGLSVQAVSVDGSQQRLTLAPREVPRES